MIPLAICAAPRNEPVFRRSLASVYSAGFPDVTVFAEPGTDIPLGANVIWNKSRLGEWHNWLKSARWLLDNRDGERLATMQDDILICRRVHAFAEHVRWPSASCGVLHLYTSRRYAGCYPRGISQLNSVHAKSMSGACLMLFNRDGLKCLIDAASKGWRGHTSKTITEPHLMEGLDTYIGEALTRHGREIWICNPSLGEHIAKESTLGHGGPYGSRVAAAFPGEEADAFEVLSCCV